MVEIFGLIGGGMGMLVGIPQALRVRRAGHGDGVNLKAWLFVFASTSTWAAYGFSINSPSMLITNLLASCVNSFVVYSLMRNHARSLLILISILLGTWISIAVLPDFIISVIMVASVFAQLPQALESYKNMRTGAPTVVSLPAQRVSFFSLCFWMAYAVTIEIPLIVLTTSIALSVNLSIMLFETLNVRKSAA